MDPFVFITVVTLIAGAGGTGLGGIVGALFRSESNRTVSLLLSFAGGIMLSIVCFDLLTESVEAAETFTSQAVLVAAGVHPRCRTRSSSAWRSRAWPWCTG